MFKVYGPIAGRLMRLGRQNKNFQYGPSFLLVRALLYIPTKIKQYQMKRYCIGLVFTMLEHCPVLTPLCTEKIPNVTSKFLSHLETRLSNMTWSNSRFNVSRSFVTMATNLPFCFLIQILEQLLKFLLNFTLLKQVKPQRSYDFLITKELFLWLPNFGFFFHFAASLKSNTPFQGPIRLWMDLELTNQISDARVNCAILKWERGPA